MLNDNISADNIISLVKEMLTDSQANNTEVNFEKMKEKVTDILAGKTKKSSERFRVEVYNRKNNNCVMIFYATEVRHEGKIVSFFAGEKNPVAFYSDKQCYHKEFPEYHLEKISVSETVNKIKNTLAAEKTVTMELADGIVLYSELFNGNRNGEPGIMFSATNLKNNTIVKSIACRFDDEEEVQKSLAWIFEKFMVDYRS